MFNCFKALLYISAHHKLVNEQISVTWKFVKSDFMSLSWCSARVSNAWSSFTKQSHMFPQFVCRPLQHPHNFPFYTEHASLMVKLTTHKKTYISSWEPIYIFRNNLWNPPKPTFFICLMTLDKSITSNSRHPCFLQSGMNSEFFLWDWELR